VGEEAMTASEPWRTTGHVDSSAHTQDVHTKREGRSALRDKALWVTGLVSEVNAYSILTPPWGFKFRPSWVDSSLRVLRAKDPKVRRARVCMTVVGLVLQGITGS